MNPKNFGQPEEFDRNSISIGILEPSQKTSISVGSFSGNLHIYIPSFSDNTSNTLKYSLKFESPYYKPKSVILLVL